MRDPPGLLNRPRLFSRSTWACTWGLAIWRSSRCALLGVVVSLDATTASASAIPLGNPTSPIETSVSAALSRGEAYEGTSGCRSTASPGACPEIDAAFLGRLLTDTEPHPGATVREIVELRHVRLSGTLNLSGRRVLRGLVLTGDGCSIGGLDLRNATAERPVEVQCLFTGPANFDHFKSTSSLSLKKSHFMLGLGAPPPGKQECSDRPELTLYGVDIGSDLDLSGVDGLTRDVTLSDSMIVGNLWIGGARFSKKIDDRDRCGVQLQAIKVGRNLVLGDLGAGYVGAQDSTVSGTFEAAAGCADEISVAGADLGRLLLTRGNHAKECSSKTNVGAANVEVRRDIAAGAEVAPDATAAGVVLGRVELAGGHVGGNVDFRNAMIASFEAADLRVGGRLTMGTAFEGKVDLAGADVHDDLDITASQQRGTGPLVGTYHGDLAADGISVGNSIYLSGGVFEKAVRLVRARVGGNIDLKGARASRFDLSSSVVGGEVRLWPDGAGVLSLAGAKAGSIDEGTNPADGKPVQTFPICEALPYLELSGLTYSGLAGFDAPRNDILDRPSWWLECMLGRQPTFAFQPYRELATHLRAAGFPDKADNVLRAGNWRDLYEAAGHGRWLSVARSLILLLTIGWGIGAGYLNAVACALVLSAVGAEVLRGSVSGPDSPPRSWLWCMQASASRFLPFKLGKDFDDFFDAAEQRLSPGQRLYFLLHSALGFLVAACVAAGVAGFTQSVS